MKRFPLHRTMIAVVVLACAVYVPQMVWPRSSLYTGALSPPRVVLLGALAKLASLVFGTLYGCRSTARLERTNPARLPWTLLTTWFALWTAAQVALMIYPFVLGMLVPVPSWSDAAFFAGFVFLFLAQIRFIAVYRRSGFPVGTAREHLLIAGIATAVVAALSYVSLAPIARADAPLAARFINVAYPAMDLAAVIPMLVLLRIALAFRPGRVWTVWASLSAGLLFMAVGDFVSTYLWPSEATSFDPLVHLMYLLGYFFAACGMKLQHELLAD